MKYIMNKNGRILVCRHGKLKFLMLEGCCFDEAVTMDSAGNLYLNGKVVFINDNTGLGDRSDPEIKLHVSGAFIQFTSFGMVMSSSSEGDVSFGLPHGNASRFLLVSKNTQEILYYFLVNGIRYKSSFDERKWVYVKNFILHDGDYEFPIEWNDSVSLEHDRIILLDKNLIIHEVHKFRPAVYFCAFSSMMTLEMAFLSIKSYALYSKVDFSFVVFTNIENIEIPTYVKQVDIKIINTRSAGLVSHYFKRYHRDVLNHLKEYSPVLYSDTDILCSNDLSQFVSDVFCGNKIFCSEEKKHDIDFIMNSGWHIGHFHKSDDNFHDTDVKAVNSGFFAYKSVHEWFDMFGLVSRLGRKVVEYMPEPPFCYDQGVFNYVITKLGVADLEIAGKYVLHWPPADFDHIERRGVIHFCGGDGSRGRFATRYENMQAYLAYLERLDNAGVAP